MRQFTEIRWHGRGGQGTVTAAKTLAEAAVDGGKFVQAFPEYGPERMGAPLRAYNRVSNKQILLHCSVTNPGYVIIVDQALVDNPVVLEGTDKDTVFIVNSSHAPSAVAKKLGVSPYMVHSVNANKISLETIGRVMPNTPMLGATVKVTQIVNGDIFVESMRKSFGKKFSEAIIAANIEAVKRSFVEVENGDE